MGSASVCARACVIVPPGEDSVLPENRLPGAQVLWLDRGPRGRDAAYQSVIFVEIEDSF